MRGVYFGNYHTVADWGLILSAKNINPPTPKIVTVPLDGRDGDLDLSRALTGDIKFNNREASFTFLITEGTQSDRAYMIRNIINAIHGQRLNVIEPDFPDYYLVGECSVKDVFNDKAYGSFTVSADCEPYRYAINEVSRTINVTSTATATDVILTNSGRKTLIPTVTVTGIVEIVTGTSATALAEGTYKLTSLFLPTGATTVSVRGNGSVKFAYREAVL